MERPNSEAKEGAVEENRPDSLQLTAATNLIDFLASNTN